MLIERSKRPVCPETGRQFRAKRLVSLNAEHVTIFDEIPNFTKGLKLGRLICSFNKRILGNQR